MNHGGRPSSAVPVDFSTVILSEAVAFACESQSAVERSLSPRDARAFSDPLSQQKIPRRAASRLVRERDPSTM